MSCGTLVRVMPNKLQETHYGIKSKRAKNPQLFLKTNGILYLENATNNIQIFIKNYMETTTESLNQTIDKQ